MQRDERGTIVTSSAVPCQRATHRQLRMTEQREAVRPWTWHSAQAQGHRTQYTLHTAHICQFPAASVWVPGSNIGPQVVGL